MIDRAIKCDCCGRRVGYGHARDAKDVRAVLKAAGWSVACRGMLGRSRYQTGRDDYCPRCVTAKRGPIVTSIEEIR